MKKIVICLLITCHSLLFTTPSFAYAKKPALDKVSYVLTASEWVNTKTAKVEVTVNASLNNQDLAKAREAIMGTLNQVAKGQWHIINFNRSQDSSGLEKLLVVANARVEQANLVNLNKNAKNISKPGLTYKVTNVDFSPSLAEKNKVKAQLRQRLYQKIDAELTALNQTYPSQHFSVNRIIFADDVNKLAMNQSYKMQAMPIAMLKTSANSAITVSNKLILNAFVTLASNRPKDK